MGHTDTLSYKDHINTTEDNAHTPILPEPMIINALDLILSHHIQQSSASNPFVLKALASLVDSSPLFTHANLSDLSFDNRHLYFHHHMYVPPSAHSTLLHSIHSSPLSGHMGVFCTKFILECDFWWPGLSTFVKHSITGCAICQQNKVNTHPTVPRFVPSCPPFLSLSNSSLLI